MWKEEISHVCWPECTRPGELIFEKRVREHMWEERKDRGKRMRNEGGEKSRCLGRDVREVAWEHVARGHVNLHIWNRRAESKRRFFHRNLWLGDLEGRYILLYSFVSTPNCLSSFFLSSFSLGYSAWNCLFPNRFLSNIVHSIVLDVAKLNDPK